MRGSFLGGKKGRKFTKPTGSRKKRATGVETKKNGRKRKKEWGAKELATEKTRGIKTPTKKT